MDYRITVAISNRVDNFTNNDEENLSLVRGYYFAELDRDPKLTKEDKEEFKIQFETHKNEIVKLIREARDLESENIPHAEE